MNSRRLESPRGPGNESDSARSANLPAAVHPSQVAHLHVWRSTRHARHIEAQSDAPDRSRQDRVGLEHRNDPGAQGRIASPRVVSPRLPTRACPLPDVGRSDLHALRDGTPLHKQFALGLDLELQPYASLRASSRGSDRSCGLSLANGRRRRRQNHLAECRRIRSPLSCDLTGLSARIAYNAFCLCRPTMDSEAPPPMVFNGGLTSKARLLQGCREGQP